MTPPANVLLLKRNLLFVLAVATVVIAWILAVTSV